MAMVLPQKALSSFSAVFRKADKSTAHFFRLDDPRARAGGGTAWDKADRKRLFFAPSFLLFADEDLSIILKMKQ